MHVFFYVCIGSGFLLIDFRKDLKYAFAYDGVSLSRSDPVLLKGR